MTRRGACLGSGASLAGQGPTGSGVSNATKKLNVQQYQVRSLINKDSSLGLALDEYTILAFFSTHFSDATIDDWLGFRLSLPFSSVYSYLFAYR